MLLPIERSFNRIFLIRPLEITGISDWCVVQELCRQDDQADGMPTRLGISSIALTKWPVDWTLDRRLVINASIDQQELSVPPADKEPRRRRFSPAVREQEILQGAIAFFAEFGFDGGTRELAARLGVNQSLLYRYFPSKEALLDRVYEEVYLKNWNPQWALDLADRRTPLKRRLTAFYCDYAKFILTYEWVRLFMFAGLKGLDFNARYLKFLRGAIFEPVVMELRAANKLSLLSPLGTEEIALVWGLHAAIYYIGVRRWIYELPVPLDMNAEIALCVRSFLQGTPAVVKQLAANPVIILTGI